MGLTKQEKELEKVLRNMKEGDKALYIAKHNDEDRVTVMANADTNFFLTVLFFIIKTLQDTEDDKNMIQILTLIRKVAKRKMKKLEKKK